MRPALRWATPLLGVVDVVLLMSGVLDVRSALAVAVVVEMLLAVSAAGTALVGLRVYRRGRDAGATPWRAFVAAVHVVVPRPLAALLLHEAATVRSLWLALRRRDDGVGPGDRAFGHADGVGLTMGALTAVAAVEVVVVHLVAPWPWLRGVLLVVGLWTVVVVLGTWAGLRRHPHVVTGDGLLLRAGPAVVVEVPWQSLVAVRRTTLHEPASVRVVGRRLHLPVHGSTTLVAELREPVAAQLPFGRTAEVDSIAFSADDPDALRAALTTASCAQERLRG